MTARRILTADEPILRKRTKKVKSFDASLKGLVEDMVETMHSANGLGLAAPQVGELLRVVVIQIPEEYEEPEAGKLFVLINPEILEASSETEEGEEGCLSVPGLIGEVSRSHKVVVRAYTPKGKRFQVTAEGFMARVLQHELDHLDGVLFIDRVTGPEKLRRLTPEGEKEPIQAVA